MRVAEGPVRTKIEVFFRGHFLPQKACKSAQKGRKDVLFLEVNQKELASCLGISARQVRNLRENGLFQLPDGVKKYPLEKCVREYINFKINEAEGRSASISKEKIQIEHEQVKIEIAKLNLRQKRRELHEAADVEAFLSDMLIRFRERMMSLPAKLAMGVAGETDINVIIETLQGGIMEALNELAEYDPDEIDSNPTGTIDDEIEEIDDGDSEEEEET